MKFIEGRYSKLDILKKIVFDLGKFANERDNIQKIVENNYWLFGEQYNLATADKTMATALKEYNYILYGAKSPTTKLEHDDEMIGEWTFLCAMPEKLKVILESTLMKISL